MEEEDSAAAIGSTSDNTITVTMDENSPSESGIASAASNLCSEVDSGMNDARSLANRISSSGADEESETDELTIDDTCVNNEDIDDDNNVAIVSSSSLHQMNEEEEEEEEEDDEEAEDGAASSGYVEPEAVAVTSLPLHDEEEDEPMDDVDEPSGQSMVSTTSSETINTNSNTTFTAEHQENSDNEGVPQRRRASTSNKEAEDEVDVDIDGIEENNATIAAGSSATPASPPTATEVGDSPHTQSQFIDSPDASSQEQSAQVIESPPQSPDNVKYSPEPVSSKIMSPTPPPTAKVGAKEVPGSPPTEAILSQDNFSQFNSPLATLSTITSSSSVGRSQDTKTELNTTLEDEPMDTSQIDSSQGGTQTQTQSSPNTSEVDNEDSQHSSVIAMPSEKTVSNGSALKSRSKSRSRSNTDDGDDVDLEDGEIMDDEEEEVKAAPALKDRVDREKEKPSKSSSGKERSSEKEKERVNKEKEKEKEREKEKHRKEKKRSKREEEKEKEKEKESNKKNKKRKASDAGEGEHEDYHHFGRGGASPGAAVAPIVPQQLDPWSAPPMPLEEFGDDSKVSRAKRRRESDGDSHVPPLLANTSPHHHQPQHHHSRPQQREQSPTSGPGGGGPPGRRMDNNNRNKRPGREERKEPKSDVICAYFMQGKCQKSAMECSFSHDAVPPRKMELCKFWMMECCAKKEKCLYLHNDFPCKYYHTGLICKAGDRCKFSHNPLSDVTKQVLLKHIETAPKEILGDFPRLNRQGAINLINKMEARLRGEKFEDEKEGFSDMNPNEHHHGRGPPMLPPPHERHHGHGRNDERHRGRDHHGGGHGHGHGGHHGHANQRGNDMRGNAGRGDDRHHNNNNNNNRGSRWEQQQPTRDDQEKLQELMHEAGISGFYKDTLDTGVPPPGSQPPPGPPGPYPGMQPPLLPLNPVLMSQMLPGLIPQSRPNSVNNPALATMLASLNLPNTSIPPTTLAAGLPQLNQAPPNVPPPLTSSHGGPDDSGMSSDGKVDHLPKMQQELFMRIQKQQQKNEKKMQHMDKPEPEEQVEDWYSSEEEDEPKKKEKENKSKTEISDKISSVLNQIRQQSQPKTSSPSSLPLPPISDSKPPSFYGDTDFRSQPSSFKDIDLRNPSSMFKKIDIEPAKEINASLTFNGPITYKVKKVLGIPKIDYSSVRMGLPPSSIVLDPRLGPKRNNSMPAPASPTETSAPDIGIQPLTIPDGTPVFDPRTSRGGGNSGRGGGGPPGITPQQNNPFLDSDNRFVSLPNSAINDYPSLFNRDPRGGGGGPNQGGPGNSGPQAQNIAAMAAAMAAMQQANMNAPGIDPNLLMFGLPFLPQQGGQMQNPLDFQQMLAASGAGNLRMRPPFNPQQQASSSWERLNQGQQGQGGGDLTPPL